MIDLYTAQTPNGRKISILLEELEIPYTLKPIHFENQEQKTPQYLKINPNGKIPAIVDRDNDDFPVFESGAVLVYLAEKYGKFIPQDLSGRSLVLQWLFFQVSGVGPAMGNAMHFLFSAPQRYDYALNRYLNETKRMFDVLDNRLAENDYLAGDYSIADMAVYPWLYASGKIGVELDEWLNLKRWYDVVGSRPAVQKGMIIPSDEDILNTTVSENFYRA